MGINAFFVTIISKFLLRIHFFKIISPSFISEKSFRFFIFVEEFRLFSGSEMKKMVFWKLKRVGSVIKNCFGEGPCFENLPGTMKMAPLKI